MEDSNLTKHQKKMLRKEKRKKELELERTKRKRKQIIGKIKTYGIAVLIILAVMGFFYWRSIPPEDAPIIDITPDSYNFGTVSQSKGTVSVEMTIANKGAGDLILNNMDSSCACTSASVIYDGVEGPRFSMSMHGTNPKNWKQVIPPGETAKLKIYYNPNVHKDLRGIVTRSILVFSNSPGPPKEVRISVNQVD